MRKLSIRNARRSVQMSDFSVPTLSIQPCPRKFRAIFSALFGLARFLSLKIYACKFLFSFYINLIFSLNEYPHLAGFQYAKDIALPNYSSAKIADRVIEGKISFDTLKKATQYKDMIKPRLEALIHLKESLDNEFNLYSFMPRMYPFYTTIKADYLISSHTNINNFIFIINTNSQNESKCDFLCCSTFEKGKRDYETNQRARTLLKKERIHIPSNTSVIFFDKIN